MLDAVELTRALIRYETINPPGNERPCAEFLGAMLEQAGFSVAYYPMGAGRANLIARIGGSADKKPLCFSGHTDVVPLGAAPWTVAPFAAEIADGKVYGRGSTDMKGGVAAFVTAALELAPKLAGTPGLVLVISAAEETGCEGVNQLVAMQENVLGEAGAMIVAEPTSNWPLVGHKGVLWVEGLARGVTAHGSMPEKGDNAVYKAARVVGRLETLDLSAGHEFTVGAPTVNVGWLRGGLNVNSVPDEARFGVDIRMVPGITAAEVMARLAEIGGTDASFTLRNHAPVVWSEPSDPWIAGVFQLMREIAGASTEPAIATYFTDAAALTKAYGYPPTLILGPGDPAMAHQTDEYCHIHRIEEARAAFTQIARDWCGV
jgi:succinyl-diaminopimelate desuccinylase